MEKVRDKVKQGAEEAARILDEYKQRLTLAIEEEGEEMQKAARYIAKSKRKVERIAAEFREKAK